MPMVTVNGSFKVNVDIREAMNAYLCSKVGIGDDQYPHTKFALDDLASILISLGKERGIKIKVAIDQK